MNLQRPFEARNSLVGPSQLVDCLAEMEFGHDIFLRARKGVTPECLAILPYRGLEVRGEGQSGRNERSESAEKQRSGGESSDTSKITVNDFVLKAFTPVVGPA